MRFRFNIKQFQSLVCLVIIFTATNVNLFGQDLQGTGLEIQNLPTLKGARNDLTNSLNILSGSLQNRSSSDKESLIVSQYKTDSKKQYGRKLWIPSKSEISFFYTMGPLKPFVKKNKDDPTPNSAEIQSFLYDITDGEKNLIKSKNGRVHHSSIIGRTEGNSRVALIGGSSFDIPSPPPLYRIKSEKLSDLENFMILIRSMQRKSIKYDTISSGLLPASEDAYKGLAYLVIAGNQIQYDAAGCRALRNWLENDGGKLWILLDRVSESTVSTLLGETVLYQEVERISLNDIEVEAGLAINEESTEPLYTHEIPINFVKVLTDPQDVINKVNGWPASFMKKIGKGSILFTTLGARGWTRELRKGEKHPLSNRESWVPTGGMEQLMFSWQDSLNENSFNVENHVRTLEERIGHSILDRSKVISILGAFCGSLLIVGVLLRILGKTSYFGLVGPLVSVGVSGFFISLGISSQHKTPATIATYQFVNVIEESNDLAINGLTSVYYPKTYNDSISINRGGRIHFNEMIGSDGINLIQTDLDSWVFEGVSMPSGSVQTTRFEVIKNLSQPLLAECVYSADGITGKIDTDLFHQFEDAIILTPQARLLRVDINSDGTFSASPDSVLESNVYIKASNGISLLDDQNRHAKIYSDYLTKPKSKEEPNTKEKAAPLGLEGRNLLLVWSTPINTNFEMQKDSKIVGNSLLAIPLVFEKVKTQELVAIPAPLISYKSIEAGGEGQSKSAAYSNLNRKWNNVSTIANTRLRFQMPDSVLPFKLEKVKLTLKVQATSRELTVVGLNGKEKVTIKSIDSPLGIYPIEIKNQDLLSLDDQGGLLLEINVGDDSTSDGLLNKKNWLIDFVELEAFGSTQK